MATCPNKSHPDWKTLVARHGETGAYQKYIDNGDNIPVPENVTRREKFDISGARYKSRDTLQALNDNPVLAKQIIDKLRSLFPNVNVYEKGLFDENGQWREIQPGEKGMHYRNAFQGAVAWANDSFLETPPHEYAHEYVDMFRDIPVIKRAIEKYGEEGLVKRMGSYFAKREMSNSFQKFMQDFWASIKSLVGSPDIADIISKNFHEGKTLDGPVNKGTAIIQYQKDGGVYKPSNGGVNSDGKYVTNRARGIDTETAKGKIIADIKGKSYDSNTKEFDLQNLRYYLNDQENFLNSNDRIRDANDKDIGYKNSPNLDERTLRDTRDIIRVDESLDKISKALINEEVELSKDEQSAFETILDIKKRIDYMGKFNTSFSDGNGGLISMTPVVKNMKKELSNTTSKRKSLYDKIPNKQLKQLLKILEKGLGKFQINLRLASKYFSGGENTEFSDMVYKSIDQAEGKRLEISHEFNDNLRSLDGIKGFKKWSLYQAQGSSIDQLDTIDVSVEEEGNPGSKKKIKLTKAEVLALYLNLRQDDSSKAIRNEGFVLDEEIDGRDIDTQEVHKLSINEATKIIKTVEADSEMMEVVKKIDNALDGMYSHTNYTFTQEHGYELPKIENYFPVYVASEKSIGERRSKSSINEWRAGHARMGQDKPLRVGDVMGIMSNVRNSGSLYAAFSLPIINNRKLLKAVESEYADKDERVYFDNIKGVLNTIEDGSNIYNSESEKSFSKWVNNLTSNFAVSVLGMNLAVMFKQPVSYITAMEEIDKKFLKMAGWGVGGIIGISPLKILKSLSYTGIKGGETMLAVEWAMDTTNPTYQEMLKSPKMRARLEGMISKEAGEALLNADIGKDKIKMPWKNKDGTQAFISKARLMEGIKIFDSVTIMAIWEAAKHEAAELHPELEKGSEAYWNHIEGRVNIIVNKTQPTYDAANRAALSLSSNPIARVLTMFSSARSKVAMLMLDSVIEVINNPSPENKMKLFKRSVNVMVTTSILLAAIDLLKAGALYGMDDDDDFSEMITFSMINNNMGYLYGIGNLSSLVTSQMDDKPWHKNMQHPVEGMTQEISQAIAHLFKGNFDKALFKSLDATFKITGLPLAGKTYTKALATRLSEE